MADRELNYRITVDQSAGTAGIRDFSRTVTSELRKAEKSLDDTETAAQRAARALGQMADQAETELRGAARAADALGQAMGPELAAKLGQNGIAQAVGDLNRMGVSFEQIEADADALAGALKRIDDVQVSAADQGLGNLSGRLNEVDDAAVKGRNAMANMFGNVAQDAGSLAGPLGSLGVGIGQLAEGAADAALGGQGLTSALKSTALMAGPIAGLGAAMMLVNDAMASNAKSREAVAADVERMSDAMRQGGDVAENYAESLRDAGEVVVTLGDASLASTGMLGKLASVAGLVDMGSLAQQFGAFGKEVADLTPVLGQAGITVDQWAKIVTGSADDLADLESAIRGANLPIGDQRDIVKAAANAQDNYATAARNAAHMVDVFGDSAADAAAKTAEAETQERRWNRQVEASEAAAQRLADQINAEAEAQERATAATKEHADALNEQVDAATRAADSGLAVADAQARYNELLADSTSSTEQVRDAALSLADAQAQLADDQAAAAGATLTTTNRLDNQNTALLTAARAAKGPARDAILNYIAALNGIPPERVSEIIPDIDNISLEEAWAALSDVSATRQTAIVADADTAQYDADMARATADKNVDVNVRLRMPAVSGWQRQVILGGGAVPQSIPPTDDAAAAGRGLVAADDGAVAPAAAAASLTLDVPVAVQPVALTLDMRGAIMGSRYDIVRTVRAAARDGIRIAGTRGQTP